MSSVSSVKHVAVATLVAGGLLFGGNQVINNLFGYTEGITAQSATPVTTTPTGQVSTPVVTPTVPSCQLPNQCLDPTKYIDPSTCPKCPLCPTTGRKRIKCSTSFASVGIFFVICFGITYLLTYKDSPFNPFKSSMISALVFYMLSNNEIYELIDQRVVPNSDVCDPKESWGVMVTTLILFIILRAMLVVGVAETRMRGAKILTRES